MGTFTTWSLDGAPAEGPPPELSPELAAACAAVGRDVLRTAGGRLPAGVDWVLAEDDVYGTTLLGWRAADGPLFARSLPVAAGDAELACFVAELVQDHLAGYTFTQWPSCPGHAHLLRPAAGDAGGCWWVCPGSGRRVAAVGGLGPCGGPPAGRQA
ncbi:MULTISPECIES: hypothetical protein [Kitasatospora]|uniref:Uncharacterized protein n=1 Tax=Kitasatospora setae (strain ATCC 33774 / DSM 43861 / JCM 3304 / KCC A-0304 / NBRC 14216 / KM-6054) TaxID=452652 RepID=E4NJU3_KITSK|nr:MULTISPECIES: hypothetical protein [Kitasatospora]BAJ33241.1 hypothetical protein KSE_74860 [Kitasatospora setae KM-6054]